MISSEKREESYHVSLLCKPDIDRCGSHSGYCPAALCLQGGPARQRVAGAAALARDFRHSIDICCHRDRADRRGDLGHSCRRVSTAYNVLLYFVVVALSEEGFKYLLLKKRTWYSSEFNCQFDGVVYAVFVALGFALWENISYVLMYGLGTAAIRAVTAVPGTRASVCSWALSTALPSATTTLATRPQPPLPPPCRARAGAAARHVRFHRNV